MTKKIENNIRPNCWYEDKDGKPILYLGKAQKKHFLQDSFGPIYYLYIKESCAKNTVANYDKINSKTLLELSGQRGVRCYCFSQKPRKLGKFIKEQAGEPIHGFVDAWDAHYNFK